MWLLQIENIESCLEHKDINGFVWKLHPKMDNSVFVATDNLLDSRGSNSSRDNNSLFSITFRILKFGTRGFLHEDAPAGMWSWSLPPPSSRSRMCQALSQLPLWFNGVVLRHLDTFILREEAKNKDKGAGWCTCNLLGIGDTPFQSRPWHNLTWLKVFLGISQSLQEIAGIVFR
jgi:hypothetical protein